MKRSTGLAAVALIATATLALAGCVQKSGGGDSGGEGDKSVTVFVSGDTNVQDLWQKGLVPAFEKANPGYKVKVDFDLHGQHDQQTVAKVTAATVQKRDPGIDLIDGGFVAQLAEGDLLQSVGEKEVPNLKTVPDGIMKAAVKDTVPYRASSVLLAYNAKEVPTPPKTLDDLLSWIKQHPGKFTYNSGGTGGSGDAFVTTVLDKGVPEDDRAKMAVEYVPELETEWDAGFETLRGLNPYVYQKGVYPNGNNGTLELLSSGQIWMTPVWSDQFVSGVESGQIPEDTATTQISDPSFTGGASLLGIPKASKHVEAAQKLADWVLTPEAQEIVSTQVSGYPVIELSLLPEDTQKKFADADIANLRPPYYEQMGADMAKLWAQKVPGK
ncbi:extracellular solute-binding protein [Microbacterium sp. NPDC057659]|uniref:extracellular solute-binding protein n=1 Tax=Microbacterium sp. NPDC057659 TaxID=3346198 RepID=UPI00366C9246